MNKKSDRPINEPGQSFFLPGSSWKDVLLSLVTGFLLFIAVSLLLNPRMEKLKATWTMYYRDF